MYSKNRIGNRNCRFKLQIIVFHINSISLIEPEEFRETSIRSRTDSCANLPDGVDPSSKFGIKVEGALGGHNAVVKSFEYKYAISANFLQTVKKVFRVLIFLVFGPHHRAHQHRVHGSCTGTNRVLRHEPYSLRSGNIV